MTRLVFITLCAVVLVILAGSVVRSSGSGMGCPDWPKCFGTWIPPTDANQIPEDYKSIYSQKREVKIIAFAKYLQAFGFAKEANQLLNDKSLLEEQDFNVYKTWTEYINRLLGFIAGNLMLIQLVWIIIKKRKERLLLFLAFLNLILISFTAWLGAIVVATNLLPWLITLHMSLALLIVVIQVKIYRLVSSKLYSITIFNKRLLLILILLTAVQIILGTQVRQQIDQISDFYNGAQRDLWIASLNSTFYIHRSFSLLILLISLYLYWKTRIIQPVPYLNIILIIIGLEIISGVVMAYLNVPAFAQPIHLLLSTGLLIYFTLSYFSVMRFKSIKLL